MSRLDEKQYLVDGDPTSGSELIRMAASIDEAFDRDWLKQTSVAAEILRNNGQEVGENPDVEV